MPNGRSGGFPINTTAFADLVAPLPDGVALGIFVGDSANDRLRPISKAETLRIVTECSSDRLAVEEQDHSSYIVHFSNTPRLMWLVVAQDSPLFAGLRSQHTRWNVEHPDWNGWLGF